MLAGSKPTELVAGAVKEVQRWLLGGDLIGLSGLLGQCRLLGWRFRNANRLSHHIAQLGDLLLHAGNNRHQLRDLRFKVGVLLHESFELNIVIGRLFSKSGPGARSLHVATKKKEITGTRV